jgi:hypothetical protein
MKLPLSPPIRRWRHARSTIPSGPEWQYESADGFRCLAFMGTQSNSNEVRPASPVTFLT